MDDDRSNTGKWAVSINSGEDKPRRHIRVDRIIAAIEVFGKLGLPAIYFAFNVVFFSVGIAASK